MYSWGRGTFGRLGNASESDQNLPVKVKLDTQFDKPPNFVAVAAGAYHSLALSGNTFIIKHPFCQFC